MQRKPLLYSFRWLFPYFVIFACAAQAPQTRINIQLLGPEQGLPSRNTRCLAQDGRGFMWVATGQDLWRYDGYTFQNFTGILSRSTGGGTLINQVVIGPKGNVWVAHNNGISIIDPIHFACKTIDPSRHIKGVDSGQNLNVFFDRQDNAWVAIPRGKLVKINKEHVPVDLYDPSVASGKSLSVESVVNKLFCDVKSNVYAYTKGNFLDLINKKEKAARRINLLGELPAAQFQVSGLLKSGHDELTVYYGQQGSTKSLTRKYSLQNHTFGPLLNADIPFIPEIIYPDSKGYIWYKTEHQIGFLDPKTAKFTLLNDRLEQNASASMFFFASLLSADDSFWISSADGLFKVTLTGEIFRKYLSMPQEKRGDIGSSIRGITEDSTGKIWACSYGFHARGFDYMFHQIDPVTGLDRHMILHGPKNRKTGVIPYKVLFAQNQVYAVTDGTQFLRIDPETEEYFPVEFPFVSGRGFTSFYKLNEHIFWMGNWGGMAMIDTRNMKPVSFNDQEGNFIKNVRVNHFMPWPQNRTLVSTTNGLYIVNKDATIHAHFGQEKKDEIKLPALQIFHNTWHENALWAGSTQGLIRIDTTRKTARLFTTEDGLPDNNIYAALPDKLGNLWLSTNKGLSRFNTKTQKFYNYGVSDGLPHMEFNHSSYLKAKDGTLYFGGLNGIVAFDPTKLDTNAHKERGLQLISYSKYNAEQNRIDTVTNHQSRNEIVFNPGDRLFAFSFMSPDYHNTALNRFRYQLEGWDDDGWHIFENGNKLLLTSLPPGRYQLRVQVSVAGADWGTQEWQAPVRVVAPWYKSLWFFILSTLGIGLLIYFFYRYQLRQVLQIQQIRNGISADMHDEIGSTLSSITFYSQALLMQMDKAEHQQVVQKIKDNAQQVQEGLSDIVWSVKSGSDEIQDVFARMFRFGSGLAESKGIAFHFETDPRLDNRKLDMQTRKNLYLIFKEAINNAAKYAECSTLRVVIGYENGGTNMVIRDNGKGFDRLVAKQGNGLSNMEHRAAQMKGKLTIQSGKEQGTVIELVF